MTSGVSFDVAPLKLNHLRGDLCLDQTHHLHLSAFPALSPCASAQNADLASCVQPLNNLGDATLRGFDLADPHRLGGLKLTLDLRRFISRQVPENLPHEPFPRRAKRQRDRLRI